MNNTKNIIISGGGTGGHLFPALALGDSLKSMGYNVKYIGSKYGIESEVLKKRNEHAYFLNIKGIQRSLTIHSIINNLIFPIRFILSYIKSWKIITSLNPCIIIGTGGYASGLPLLVGVAKKITTLIQEQNSFPGITTRKLHLKVNSVCIAYKKANDFLNNTGVITGNPIRKNLKVYQKQDAVEYYGLNINKPILLIIGGSQGSLPFNNHFKDNYKKYIDNNIQIIWQCGQKNSYLEGKFICEGLIIKPFIKNIDYAYSAADIVVSRAGALAIEELKLFAKPMILIPFPHAANNHQYYNAQELYIKEAAILVEQSQLTKGDLEKIVFNTINDTNKLKSLSDNAKTMSFPNAINDINKIIMRLIEDV